MTASAQPPVPPVIDDTPSALGQWRLQVDTPIGTKATQLGLEQASDGVRGWMIDLFGQRIATTEAEIDGDQVRWRMDITAPVTLTIHFTGTVTGHRMSGRADCAVAKMAFVGTRQGGDGTG